MRNRNFWIMLLGDAVLIFFSYFFAYYLRFDGHIPPKSLASFMHTVIWIVPLKLACFFFFNLYKGMWRYTSIHDLINLIKACVSSSAIITGLLLFTVRFGSFARSVFIIDLFLTFLLVGGFRIGIRLFYAPMNGQFKFLHKNRDSRVNKLLIYGAGAACEMLLREIRGNPNLHYDVVGLIDDDVSKLKHTIHGVPVLGTAQDMNEIAKNSMVDEIIIAIPSASAIQMRRIVKSCETTGFTYKTLPGMGELIEGKVAVNAIRPVRYEDLLGRKQVDLNVPQIGDYLTGKTVMVTGGAGSIGSELCRQIAPFGPESLLIVDKDESGLYETGLNLSAQFPKMQVYSFLGSVQNMVLMQKIFQKHQVNVVFHAAAYKHVPMMELHPWEAVYNNIIGTQNILKLCSGNGVDRCVVVSTDKAVRPTNVMGASKRIDELLVQLYAREHDARFMAVRFGNVVGSAGSVIPLFQEQIKRGGPVTVTHRQATRYFMTIPEASRLILQTGAIGSGGEIFVLGMGTPIRIADMARDLIRLSGFKSDEDVEIKEIGLRPGEKLYEELITADEGIQETEHKEIMVLHGDNHISMKEMERYIKKLVKLADAMDAKAIKEVLNKVIPEYEPQETESAV